MAHRYAIIGTGALGGYYGARLHHAHREVHFLLRSDAEYVQHAGLKVDSPDGDFSIQANDIHAYHDVHNMPRCDVVCVCLKTTHNRVLAELLPHVLADDGVVVLLQNGLGIEDDVASIVGPNRVMSGLCFLCSNKVGPGHIKHLDYGQIRLGEYAADGTARGVTDRMKSIGADLEAAGIPHLMADDLRLARWQKLVWNIPFNGLSVALDATTSELMADDKTLALAEALMWEVVNGAKAFGRAIAPAFVQKMLDDTARMTPYMTSMMLDYQAKRPLEIEAIFANPIAAAASEGVYMTRTESLYQQLSFLDRRNRA